MTVTKTINPTMAPVATSKVVSIRSIELVNLLMEQRGSTFVSIVAKTEPKMRKTGNPHAGNCFKVNKISCQINFIYDGAVLRQLAKEGKSPEDFKSGESWHEPVLRADGTLTPFARHKQNGKLYIRARHLATIGDPVYEDSTGKAIPTSEIEPFLPNRDNAYANQGTEETIRFVIYGLDTIQQITMDGVTYQIL